MEADWLIPKLSNAEKKEFSIYYNKHSVFLYRLAMLILILATIAYFYLDFLAAPYSYRIIWSLRLVALIGVFIVYLISFINKEFFIRRFQWLVASAIFLYNICILLMIYYSKPGEMSYEHYFIGLLVIFIASIPLRIRLISVLYHTLTITVLYVLIAIFKQNLLSEAPYMFIYNMFFIISTVMAVIMAAYVLEVFIRKSFLNRKMLEAKNKELLKQKKEIVLQKEELSALTEQLQFLNKKLEYKVIKRTKELNKALTKAENSEKMISSFLANFSHEIRTPMNAISGFAQLFATRDISEENRQKYSHIINQNIDMLLHLIDNVMEVAKLRSNRYEAHKTIFYPATECANIYQEIKHLLNDKDIKFIAEIEEIKNLKLYGDKRAFRHIIYNLLENAFKYTEKGEVRLKCTYTIDKSSDEDLIQCVKQKSDDFLKIIISDTGIGIKKENLKKIFYIFSKPEENTKKLIRGTGLGLTLVKELSNRLKAQIDIQSKLNKGTTVSVAIPIAKYEQNDNS